MTLRSLTGCPASWALILSIKLAQKLKIVLVELAEKAPERARIPAVFPSPPEGVAQKGGGRVATINDNHATGLQLLLDFDEIHVAGAVLGIGRPVHVDELRQRLRPPR